MQLSGPPTFKSQRVGYRSKQKLLHQYRHKIISSIDIFIFKIQVLGPHELKSHCNFWQGTFKNDWINFQSSCICTSMQNSGYFICSVLRYSQFSSSMTRLTTPIFDQAYPKTIEVTFCFPEFAPPCKKSVHSINSFLRYSQF